MTTSLSIDPYFMAAYQSPNYYSLYAQQLAQAQKAAGTSNVSQSTSTNSLKPSFGASEQTNVQTAEEPKKNNTAKWVLGTIAVVGAAAFCIAAHNKGAGNTVWEKICDGSKKIFNSTKDKVLNIAKTNDTFKISKAGDSYVCQVPGKTNVIKGKNADTVLKGIGIDTEKAKTMTKLFTEKDGKMILDESSKLLSYTIHDGEHILTIANGKNGAKLVKAIDASGANVLNNYNKQAILSNRLNEIINGVKNGDKSIIEQLTDVRVRNIDSATGLQRYFKFENISGKGAFLSAHSKNFNIESKEVKAFLQNNEQIDKVVQELVKNNKTDGLKVLSKDLEGLKLKIDGDYKDCVATITNGKITSIKTVDGKQVYKAGTESFDAINYDNKTVFSNILNQAEDKYTNPVYAAA